jgi:hypothetical protein
LAVLFKYRLSARSCAGIRASTIATCAPATALNPGSVDRRAMRSLVLAVCAVLSVLAMSAGVLLGFFLILSPSGGGFFPNLDHRI